MSVQFRVDIGGQTVPLRFQTVSFGGIREIVQADILVDINARAAKAADGSDFATPLNGATGSTLVGYAAAGAGAVTRTAQAKLRDTVCVLDFIPVAQHAAILAGTSTYDATAGINAAHAAALRVVYPGTGVDAKYNATAISIPFGGSIIGDGVEAVRIVQVAGTASNFITLTTGGTAGDITSGRSLFQNVTIEPANVAFTGIKIGPNVRANMPKFENVVLKSQAVAAFGPAPYVTTAGSIGIDVSNGTQSAFLGRGEGLIIQGFETAVRLGAVVNDWSFDGQCWFIDNKIGFDLTDVSGLSMAGDFESGVADARCYILRGATSHVLDTSRRWELTQSGVFGMEFAGGFTGTNIRAMSPNVQLADGGAIPGKKWTGTPPADFVFHGYYLDGATLRPFMYAGGEMLLPTLVQHGGTGIGNGKIVLGRDAGGAEGILEHDGSGLQISAPNGVRVPGLIFPQTQFGSGYLQPFVIGSYSLWVDSSGRLRIDGSTAPLSDTAGVVVGTQT